MRLEGRSVLVTGGAQGMGLAIARRFAEEGADLVLLDVEGETLAAAAAALGRRRARAASSRSSATSRGAPTSVPRWSGRRRRTASSTRSSRRPARPTSDRCSTSTTAPGSGCIEVNLTRPLRQRPGGGARDAARRCDRRDVLDERVLRRGAHRPVLDDEGRRRDVRARARRSTSPSTASASTRSARGSSARGSRPC